jgi:hypothetical protein
MKKHMIWLILCLMVSLAACGVSSPPSNTLSSRPTPTPPVPVAAMVEYYTVNDGTTLTHLGIPYAALLSSPTITATGMASQSIGTGGSIKLQISGAPSTATTGFYLPIGILDDLKTIEITASGSSPIIIQIWLDTGGDGDFFAWSSNVYSSLNNDAYITALNPVSGTITKATFFSVNAAPDSSMGHVYTLAQLQAGIASSMTPSTPIAVWVGITNTTATGFTPNVSATITSLSVN